MKHKSMLSKARLLLNAQTYETCNVGYPKATLHIYKEGGVSYMLLKTIANAW